jgi:hypothetical protein
VMNDVFREYLDDFVMGLYRRYPHIQSNRRRPLEVRGIDYRTLATAPTV